MKTSYCLLTLTLLLGGCTYPIPSLERIELPSHLDTSTLDSDTRQAVNEAATAWFDATDGGIDLLTGNGHSVPVTVGKLLPDRGGQANLHPDYADIVLDLEQIKLAWGDGTHGRVRETAMHEIGHILGLQHTETGLMAPTSNASCIDADILDEVCRHYKCGPAAAASCE